MSEAIKIHPDAITQPNSKWNERLNSDWHESGLRLFMVVVLAHWAEHLVQAFQIYALHWPRPQALGLLGKFFPYLVTSEIMHYAYALVMLIGIWIFRSGFQGRARMWWNVALVIQFWHHIEHLLLQVQAAIGQNLFGSPVPMSILQIWAPRVELHLFYNTIVFIPMVIGMYMHLFPTAEERRQHHCSCAWNA